MTTASLTGLPSVSLTFPRTMTPLLSVTVAVPSRNILVVTPAVFAFHRSSVT